MSMVPTRLKPTTSGQKSARILVVRSARIASNPVAKSPYARKGRESGRQIVSNNAWKNEYEPKESKTVQRGNGPLRIDSVHRLELRQDIRAGAKQPGDVTQNELQIKNDNRRHSALLQSSRFSQGTLYEIRSIILMTQIIFIILCVVARRI